MQSCYQLRRLCLRVCAHGSTVPVRVVSRPAGHELVEDRGQVPQLVEMRGRELVQPGLAVSGQPDPRHPAVLGVAAAFDQPGRCRPVHQFDRAVVTQQQVTGEITDGGLLAAGVALDRDQQLMLGGGETNRAGLGLAPVQEAAQAGAERQQVLEVAAGQLGHLLTVCRHPCRPANRSRCDKIVSRNLRLRCAWRA